MPGRSSRSVLFFFAGAALAGGLALSQVSHSSVGRRYALLVGVRQYVEDPLPDSPYAEEDMTALAGLLNEQGYQRVVLMTQAQGVHLERRIPRAANIRRTLKEMAANLTEADWLVVAFAGHGVQFRGSEDHYFCALDAVVENKETLVSLPEVYRELERCPAGFKLLLVDASRTDPRFANAPAEAARTDTTRSRRALAASGVAGLFSCSAGETAFASPLLKRGVFFYYLVEGLRGNADLDGDRKVDLDELVLFTKKRVPDHVKKEHGKDAHQIPELVGSMGASVTLATVPDPSSSAELIDGTMPRIDAANANTITNSLGMKLVWIPAGSFLMGSADHDEEASDNEKPRHLVEITRDFYLGKHEVTRGQFRQFVAATNYRTEGEKDGFGSWGIDSATHAMEHKPEYSWRNIGYPQTDEHPVVGVSWIDAKAFCAWLSKKEGHQYRLPTEAEWEYCCRAGSALRRYSGNGPELLVAIANSADASAKRQFPHWQATEQDDGQVFTAPGGLFRPNAFGLHDMQGNVSEWCEDSYEYDYYSRSPATDPPGPAASPFHVLRGGAFDNAPRDVRSASRYGYGHRDFHLGFRVQRAR